MFTANLSIARKEEITQALGEFIVDGLQPISLVEKPAMKRLFEVVEPRYTIPSKKTLKANVLDKMQAELSKEIFKEISETEDVALTHDSWTSLANNNYETATVHYITKSWVMKGKVLSTLLVETSHTSEAIKKALLKVKDTWKLPHIHAVTDSAANEVKAFSLLEWPRLACFGHNLNLAVKAGTAIPEVNKIVAKSRNLVSFFHRSPQATTLLKEKQVTMFPHDTTKHNLNLLQDTPTRWNSTMDMLERLTLLMPAIHSLVVSPAATDRIKALRYSLLDFNEQALAEQVIQILQPFKRSTEQMSSESKPTLQYVLPWLCHFKMVLEMDSDSEAERKMKRAIGENLKKRPFDLPAYKMAAVLHPETKDLRFLSEEERTTTLRLLRDEANARAAPSEEVKIKAEAAEAVEPTQAEADQPGTAPALPALPALPDPPTLPTAPDVPDEPSPAKKPKTDNFLDDIIFMGAKKVCPRSRINDEIERYMLEPASQSPPLQWWKERVGTFPTLSRLAAKYLCIPSSSVPSERIFSLAGNIVTKKRCGLSPDNVNQLIFLHHNRKKGRGEEED